MGTIAAKLAIEAINRNIERQPLGRNLRVAGRKSSTFVTELPERPGQCSVSRAALEHDRWAPRGASEGQLLRAYQAGCTRIAVLVERDLLKTERVDHAARKRTLLSNGRTNRST
jgi:hypothetical protein